MYCIECGTKYPDHVKNCPKDGTPLRSAASTLSGSNAQWRCRSCDAPIESDWHFCVSCGASVKPDEPGALSSSRQPRFLTYFKSSLLGTLIAVLIMIFLTWVFITPLEKQLFSMIYTLNPDLYNAVFGSARSPLSLTDLIMLTHSVGGDLTIHFLSAIGSLRLADGVLFGVLVPFISLFVGGFITGRQHRNYSLTQRFICALATGLMYAVIISSLSLLANDSFHGKTAALSLHFSLILAFINAFVFGTLFSLPGLIMKVRPIRLTAVLKQSSLRYGDALHYGIAIFLSGFGVVFIIALIILIVKGGVIKGALLTLASSIQLAYYFWALLNFNTGWVSGLFDLTLSIFGSNSQTLGTGLHTWLLPGLLLSVGLNVYAGKRLAERSGRKLLIALTVYSLVYSLLMAFAARLSQVSLSANRFGGINDIFLGIDYLGAGVKTFMFSFVTAWLGALYQRWFGARDLDDLS